MKDLFKQCELSRPSDGGTAVTVGWIPAKFAVVGRIVRLKDPEFGTWSEGWRVTSAGSATLAGQVLERQSRDYLRTRKASDI